MSLILSLIMVFNILTVSATEDNNLLTQYGLEEAESLPDNVVPLSFKSFEEVEKFIQFVNDDNYNEISKSMLNNSMSDVSGMSRSSIPGIWECNWSQGINLWLCAEVGFNKVMNPTLGKYVFSSASVNRTYLHGLTLAYKWIEDTGSRECDILDGGRTLYVRIRGELEFYVIVEGFIKVYTFRKDLNAEKFYDAMN